jgi:hypothetical protein
MTAVLLQNVELIGFADDNYNTKHVEVFEAKG